MPETQKPPPDVAPFEFGDWWCMLPSALERVRARLAEPLAFTAEARNELEAAARKGIPVHLAESVAVIPVVGPLTKRYSMLTYLFGGSSYLAIKAAINAALADKRVTSILLKVDSAGGEVGGMVDLGDFIASARTQKPIIVHIDDIAASAAYYVASPATEIWAGRTAEVGSIGVYAVLYDTSEMAKKEGVRPVMVRYGDLKGIGEAGVPITKAQEAEVSKFVNRLGEEFVSAVARGRNMTDEEVRSLATGAMWPADEALSLGLIDGVRSFEATLGVMVERERSRARGRGRARTL